MPALTPAVRHEAAVTTQAREERSQVGNLCRSLEERVTRKLGRITPGRSSRVRRLARFASSAHNLDTVRENSVGYGTSRHLAVFLRIAKMRAFSRVLSQPPAPAEVQ